ncbi:MAG TPA: D-glucuronyl C5-epimerase family protein [Williamwhitmania sp.]|nr:D-glucuronyl C5-epimerase family protein [Williamwhitmania sp.]
MKKFIFIVVAFALFIGLYSCNAQKGEPVVQTSIARIDQMPNIPQPLKIIDWKKKTMQFDSLVFDFNNHESDGPLIWLDSARRNINQVTFGLYTVLGDVRQGPKKNNGEFHEALTSLSALISTGLMGIDETNNHGFNFVKMVQNYFNSDTKWNIIMNNTNPTVAMAGGGYGRDWWYDVYPNVLYYAVAALYPKVTNTDFILQKVADQFYRADSVLNGNYSYSFFNYAQMKGMRSKVPWQQDAAGGHAWVLYSAYQKFGDKRYLKGAESATEALLNQKESRFYEILLPFGAYTAARLNAEQGTHYDVTKLLNWTFDGCQDKNARYGWGVIAEKWGDDDVDGLVGSITDGGGYGFFMNSVAMAWPLVPMVKYEPQYATAIGKYMLNAVNASRLFYPDQVDDAHQWLPEMKNITHGIIGYEGLRKMDDYGKPILKGISPVSIGDGPKWVTGQPKESMFSVYSTSIVGVFGAIVHKTDVDGILALDCNATDFYGVNKYPEFLYYNPYNEVKTVTYTSSASVDLFDIISKKYLAKSVDGQASIVLPANQASLIVVLPAGTLLRNEGKKIKAGDVVIAYK